MMKHFSFDFDLVKAEASDDGKLIVSGVASDLSLDAQKDRMTAEALKSMEGSAVGVPIVTDHRAELHDVIGEVTEATAQANGTFVIKAELDSDDARAVALYKKIAKGHKAGFSVGGTITAARPSLQKNERHIISGVSLDHIALTRKPANKNTFAMAIAKSLTEIDGEQTNMNDPMELTADVVKDAIAKAEGDKVEVKIVDAPDHQVEAPKSVPNTAPSVQPEVKPEAKPSEDAPQVVSKAGSEFSSKNIGIINDALGSNDLSEVKAKLRAMIGANELDADGDGLEDAKQDGAGNFIGINKTENAPALDAETLKDIVASAVRAELAKTVAKPEGKSAPALSDNANTFDLSKVHSNDPKFDLIVAKALNLK